MSINAPNFSQKPKQLLLRLPDDLAQRFARVVPTRQRSRFILDLIRSELDRESDALARAAQNLTILETGHPAVAVESAQWVEASMTEHDDAGFDPLKFEREFAQAQAGHKAS